jgi:hypothetical protein
VGLAKVEVGIGINGRPRLFTVAHGAVLSFDAIVLPHTDRRSDRRNSYSSSNPGLRSFRVVLTDDPPVQRLLHPKASPTPWTRAGQTDIRVVAATNRDLELPLARGEFREDLYYRLNVVEIRIPPLRDRKEEILIRAARFLAKFNQQYGWSRQLSPETTARLVEYSWGGNVRELENIIRRMVVLNDGEQAFARSPGVGAGCRADGPRGSARARPVEPRGSRPHPEGQL